MTDKQTALANWEKHVAKSKPLAREAMEKRIARWGNIPSSKHAFADTYLAGHERELYSVIGIGVTDDPNFKPAIPFADNFHVNYIVAPPGCGAALHCHDTEEVFLVVTGRWALCWGDDGENEVILNKLDTVSVPPFVMRGFRNLGDCEHTLLAILGGKKPGRVEWAHKVAQAAKARGVGFDENGNAVKFD
jgi:quercetin dioxygenase-like cupin family protein